METFIVKHKYERTASIRKANTKRRQTVRARLDSQGVDYKFLSGYYSAEYIPDNIKRLITSI